MNFKIIAIFAVTLVVLSLSLSAPVVAEELLEQSPPAQTIPPTRRPNFFHILGSIVFTTFYLPIKTVTCVGTQAVAGAAYVATFNVPGSNDEPGNTGKEIGEVARKSCTGSWIVRPSQVVRDYSE